MTVALNEDDIRINSETTIMLKGIICFESGEITGAISWFDKVISEVDVTKVNSITTKQIAHHYRGICYCLLVDLSPDIPSQEREEYLNRAKSDFSCLSNLMDDRISASQRFLNNLAPITSV